LRPTGWIVLACALSGCTPEARPLPDVPAAPTADGAAEGTSTRTWSYEGATGPEHWASLQPEWAPCGGPGQSPIDLPLDGIGTTAVPPELALTLDLPASPFRLQTDGPLVSLVGGSALSLSLDGQRWAVGRIEVHSPAEHRLGGQSFDVELVLHAQDPTGRHALLSLLYRTGAGNTAWDPLLQQLPEAPFSGSRALAGPVQLGGLVPASAQVLTYEGSLSTPPCTTGVTRLVVAHVGELSGDQLARLRRAVPRSARPPTDRGARPITLRSLSLPTPGTPPASTTQAP